MKLVLIFGNSAVGKMTVGQELTKITKLRLFHNHLVIEPVLEVFNEFNVGVIEKVREVFFKEFIKTENEGLIFTFMWALDRKEDWDYVSNVTKLFSEVYYVELVAPVDVRLKRNKTENRLTNKKSKQDIKSSETRLLNDNLKARFESYENEITFKNYIKIDNTNLAATKVAAMIKERFDL